MRLGVHKESMFAAEGERSYLRSQAISAAEKYLKDRIAALKDELGEDASIEDGGKSPMLKLEYRARELKNDQRNLEAIESGVHADRLVKEILVKMKNERQTLHDDLAKMEDGGEPSGPAADTLSGEMRLLQSYIDSLEA